MSPKEQRHPTTAEMDYTPEEWEFMQAIQKFRDEKLRPHRRVFPTWSEVLRVLKGLGYEKRASGGR